MSAYVFCMLAYALPLFRNVWVHEHIQQWRVGMAEKRMRYLFSWGVNVNQHCIIWFEYFSGFNLNRWIPSSSLFNGLNMSSGNGGSSQVSSISYRCHTTTSTATTKSVWWQHRRSRAHLAKREKWVKRSRSKKKKSMKYISSEAIFFPPSLLAAVCVPIFLCRKPWLKVNLNAFALLWCAYTTQNVISLFWFWAREMRWCIRKK